MPYFYLLFFNLCHNYLGLQSFCFAKEEKTGCFTFIVFLLSFAHKCSVLLPYGAVGQSSVYDCGIYLVIHVPTFISYISY